jgi:MerR family Zn(II)-responsive transcriptional regulator of zntA
MENSRYVHQATTCLRRHHKPPTLSPMTEMAASSGTLRIGELAGELGLNPKTLRYYEAIGLLPQPRRNAAGYRLYGAADKERLAFIGKAKALGFSLQEIGEILALRDAGTEPCAHVRALIDARLAAVSAQLQLLTELREELETLQSEAERTTCSCTPICSIIELHVSPRPSPPGTPPSMETP